MDAIMNMARLSADRLRFQTQEESPGSIGKGSC